ncbi:MAG: HupE/UreJ family protein [bacterium]
MCFPLLIGAVLVAAPASPHDLNSSYTAIVVTSDSLQAVFTFDTSDLQRNFTLDTDQDRNVTRDELLAAMPVIYDYVEQSVTLAVNFSPAELERRLGGLSQDDFGNVFLNCSFAKKLNGLPAEISLNIGFFEKFGERHKNLAKIVVGEQIQQAVFSSGNSRQRFALGGKVSLLGQIGEFTKLGIEHIFLGYDHIMFLFALIVIGGRFINLVKIVTAFTVAHSLTLILAALEILKLPSTIIESGIALSIAYVAAENFVISQAGHRWVLTFIFGLVHGFGFANVLRDLGLPATGLVPSLLAFNAGVEIGQLCIVAVFFPLTLWLAKKKFQRQVVIVFSSVILLFGLGWFVERAFDLSFMPL